MINKIEDIKILADEAAEREPQDLSFRPSRPFDFFIWLEREDFDFYIKQIAKAIDDQNPPRRLRDNATHNKFIFSIKLILLNLLAAQKIKLKTLQAIPLRAGEFTAKTRYNQKHIAYRPFINAYKGLLSLNLIRVAIKGNWDKEKEKGKLTRIESSHTLKTKLDALFPNEIIFFIRHPDEENVRLKNSAKKLIDYQDTDYTREARNNLMVINACLSRHWYDLRLSNAEFSIMSNEMLLRHKTRPKKPPFIQLHERSLYRIYNNGDMVEGKNFQQGGRFYGGWWESILSNYRRKIMIDGKPTVEIDYSGYHPRMLYALEGLDLGKRDPYLPDALDKQWRDFGKLAFTKLLNGKKRINVPEEYEAESVGIAWKKLLEMMKEYHKPIAKYFHTAYGLELMRQDSDIAENILIYFAKRDIPCLPIHDSFIVHYAYADELWNCMLNEYRRVFEQNIDKKVDDGFQIFTDEYTNREENTLSIDKIIKNDQESQHERRLNLWWERIER